jgi:hypothetical protein
MDKKRMAIILLITVNIIMLIIAIIVDQRFYNGIILGATLKVKSIAIVLLCGIGMLYGIKSKKPMIKKKYSPLLILSIITPAYWIMFLLAIPKTTVDEAITLLSSQERFEAVDLVPIDEGVYFGKSYGYVLAGMEDEKMIYKVYFEPNERQYTFEEIK